MSRRRTGEILKVLFKILKNVPEGLASNIAIEMIKKRLTMSDYELGLYKSGAQRIEKKLWFVTTECVKAGWMRKERGTWFITEMGIEADNKYSDPEQLYKEISKQYENWRKLNGTRRHKRVENNSINATVTLEKAEEQAWHEIVDYLQHKNHYEFQYMVGDLLTAMGYYVSWISPVGKDGGLDLLAWNDPLGTKPPRIKVQVKRYRKDSKIAVDGLRSFMAILGDGDIGIMVSTSGFTKDAEEEARTQEKRKVTLIDSVNFYDLWIKHYESLSGSAKRKMPLKPIYFLSLDE